MSENKNTMESKTAEEILKNNINVPFKEDKNLVLKSMHDFANQEVQKVLSDFNQALIKIQQMNNAIIDNSQYAKGYSGSLTDCEGLISKLLTKHQK